MKWHFKSSTGKFCSTRYIFSICYPALFIFLRRVCMSLFFVLRKRNLKPLAGMKLKSTAASIWCQRCNDVEGNYVKKSTCGTFWMHFVLCMHRQRQLALICTKSICHVSNRYWHAPAFKYLWRKHSRQWTEMFENITNKQNINIVWTYICIIQKRSFH